MSVSPVLGVTSVQLQVSLIHLDSVRQDIIVWEEIPQRQVQFMKTLSGYSSSLVVGINRDTFKRDIEKIKMLEVFVSDEK